MEDIKIIGPEKITLEELKKRSIRFSENIVKAVVDIRLKKMAIGASMHVDEETLLLENDSQQQDLWGINIHPLLPKEQWMEFDSMINLRPWQNNRSRGIDDPATRAIVTEIVFSLIE